MSHNNQHTRREQYLVWSNEHQAWWDYDRRGYVISKKLAGKYSFRDACQIVYEANMFQKDTEVPHETMVFYQ